MKIGSIIDPYKSVALRDGEELFSDVLLKYLHEKLGVFDTFDPDECWIRRSDPPKKWRAKKKRASWCCPYVQRKIRQQSAHWQPLGDPASGNKKNADQTKWLVGTPWLLMCVHRQGVGIKKDREVFVALENDLTIRKKIELLSPCLMEQAPLIWQLFKEAPTLGKRLRASYNLPYPPGGATTGPCHGSILWRLGWHGRTSKTWRGAFKLGANFKWGQDGILGPWKEDRGQRARWGVTFPGIVARLGINETNGKIVIPSDVSLTQWRRPRT